VKFGEREKGRKLIDRNRGAELRTDLDSRSATVLSVSKHSFG
jgi:hypothetical protein